MMASGFLQYNRAKHALDAMLLSVLKIFASKKLCATP